MDIYRPWSIPLAKRWRLSWVIIAISIRRTASVSSSGNYRKPYRKITSISIISRCMPIVSWMDRRWRFWATITPISGNPQTSVPVGDDRWTMNLVGLCSGVDVCCMIGWVWDIYEEISIDCNGCQWSIDVQWFWLDVVLMWRVLYDWLGGLISLDCNRCQWRMDYGFGWMGWVRHLWRDIARLQSMSMVLVGRCSSRKCKKFPV